MERRHAGSGADAVLDGRPEPAGAVPVEDAHARRARDDDVGLPVAVLVGGGHVLGVDRAHARRPEDEDARAERAVAVAEEPSYTARVRKGDERLSALVGVGSSREATQCVSVVAYAIRFSTNVKSDGLQKFGSVPP